MNDLLNRLRNRIQVGHNQRSSSSAVIDMRLTQLAVSCNEFIHKNAIRPSIRILWPTTFNLSKTWWIHDGIWSAALRLRGADIVPIMCDRLQSDECMFWAGEWQGSGKQGFHERREAHCNQCVQNDIEMWGRWGLRPLRLTSFVTAGEILEAQDEVAKWMDSDWQNVIWRGFAVGYGAWKAVVNNNLQAEIHDWWREQAESMAYHHLLNIRLLILVYDRVFDMIAPDRVFGNGGFYYQWGVVDHVARQRHVPYFRYYRVGLHPPLNWNYARNSQKLALFDVDSAWQSWLEQPWDLEQEQRVHRDLAKRGLHVDCRSKNEGALNDISQQLGLDPAKPIALAASGVAWDANTNVPSEAFSNMYDWLWQTIHWFRRHPQWQLIIRVHPCEDVASDIAPETKTRFETEMRLKGIEPPANVYIVPITSHISTYDLTSIATVGMAYMSTTGLEMACTGLPILAIGPNHYRGKGFTFDPCNSDKYFSTLATVLSGNDTHESKEWSLLAKRYWYLVAYHGSVVTGLVDLDPKGFNNQVPKELTCYDLLPGANPYVDYICDSVIHDLPIMGTNRWPPEGPE